jgi:hypothetical protein
MKSQAFSVGTSVAVLIAADNQNRTCYVHASSGSVYLGGSAVTASTGMHLPSNQTITITLPVGEALYGIASSGTTDVRVLSPDGD